MAYQLNEEQRMIRAMVREFARETVLPTAAERDLTCEFPVENLRKMGELGLLGMNAPVEFNGAGVDTVSYCLALQEIAYACASTAVIMSVHNSVACGAGRRQLCDQRYQDVHYHGKKFPCDGCHSLYGPG